MILPEQASSAAGKVDAVFLFILALSVAFLIFITGMMVVFVIRYSRKRHPKGEDIEGHTGLEIAWTVIPLVLFLAMFYFGWTNFEYMRNAPRDAMVVKATARQWAWQFEYPNGKQTQDLYAALGKPVKVELRSLDVIHGFFVPAFRIKMDVVPGKVNTTWFTPTQLGAFEIECTVICGTKHSEMLARAVVVSEDEFKRWFFGGDDAPLPGEPPKPVTAVATPTPAPALVLLKDRGCLTCHSTDGTVMVGPTFQGLFGLRQTVTTAGDKDREVVVDEPYLERAIEDPAAEVAKGYPPAMPPGELTPAELKLVIDYLKGLKAESH
jgi:cytochrome c oxidase subunit II